VTPQFLVAGIGNIFFGDDAFGSEVARRLLRERWSEDVRIADFGIRGMDLMFALIEGYETVVIIDTTPRNGTPGTLYLIEPEVGESAGVQVEAHAMDLFRVLAAARSMGATWKRLLIVGCEPSPDSLEPDGEGAMGMSAPVTGAIEGAVQMVRRIVCKSNLASSAK
jgi:hydrogenase maturation protease